MDRETLLFLAGVALSGMLSWLITERYYGKSLENQEKATKEQLGQLQRTISELIQRGEPQDRPGEAAVRVLLRQQRIEEGVNEYKRAGTPVRVIDTYADLSNEQKAELLDTILLRARGRHARDNKYRAT